MTNITVSNTYQDSSGIGLSGTVTFTPVVTADDGGTVTFIADPKAYSVRAGVMSAILLTTDSYDVDGSVTYRVVERIGSSYRRRYYVELPSSLGESVVLSSLLTYSNPPNTLVIEGFGDVSEAITALDARLDVLEAATGGDVATHVADTDPHSVYLTEAEADALYALLAQAVPAGGTTGQVLAKDSATDNDVSWTNQTATAITSPFTVTADAVGETPITAKGMAGQTGDILRAELDGGTQALAVQAGGQLEIGNSPPTAGTVRIEQAAAGQRGINIKMKASPTADAIQVVESDGSTQLFAVTNAGHVQAPNIGNPVLILDNAEAVPDGTLEGTLIVRRPA